ncbi:MAG: urease accessory protein UreD [Burkholderiales bacterium]|nr:urease accessory protein UreD [Burkholderiales bacterium]
MHTAVAQWQARLALEYTRQGGRTTLTGREHSGPLLVQKALYPEGDAVCHSIVVHPPGGIAAGDALRLELSLREGAHALLTTPGAGKWYKSAGPQASLAQRFDLARGAVLEWLPQPAIVFNAARAITRTEVRLHRDALYMGWEMTCMGRAASGERFNSGELRQRTEVWQEERRLWCEYARLGGDDPMLTSPAGLNKCTVSATLIAAGREIPKDLLEQCRGVVPEAQAGITVLPRLLLARYLGASSEAAMRYFIALWTLLRPALAGRSAVAPRIWAT